MTIILVSLIFLNAANNQKLHNKYSMMIARFAIEEFTSKIDQYNRKNKSHT